MNLYSFSLPVASATVLPALTDVIFKPTLAVAVNVNSSPFFLVVPLVASIPETSAPPWLPRVIYYV